MEEIRTIKKQITEKQIEAYLVKMIKAIEGRCIKLNSNNYNGLMDRMVLLKGGRVFFVELKRPQNFKLSALQKKSLEDFKSLGFDCRVLKSYEEINDFIHEVAINGI